MKKINVTLLLLFIALCSSAQYKKASYLGKEGRTYCLGTNFYFLGKGSGTPMGYTLSIGRDVDGSQFFGRYEFQYIPSYNFSFETIDSYGRTATIMGKTKAAIIYGMNAGYYLLKNENATGKLKPYLTAGINIQFLGGVKESNSEEGDARVAADPQFSIGPGAGAGLLFNFTPWLALQAEGGYRYQFGVSTESEKEVYYVLPKHAYASAGLRFRITRN
jgi:hypothetical protein